MSLHEAFDTRKKELREFQEVRRKIKPSTKELAKDIPAHFYSSCPSCKTEFLKQEIVDSQFVCSSCGEHLRLRAVDRVQMLVDKYSFHEYGMDYLSQNPLGIEKYDEKLKTLREKEHIPEAYIYGTARLDGEKCIIGVMDSYFLMGSMGSVVGEKVTKTFELGIEKGLPVILFTASGGARMQEGIFSLMQMAKTSQAIAKYHEKGLLYVTVLTNPTTGGVTASFAMLGDIILAEPKALVGFAGPRVIEQTIKQTLPEGFQTSEFLLEKGYVDRVVPRNDLKQNLVHILKLHKGATR